MPHDVYRILDYIKALWKHKSRNYHLPPKPSATMAAKTAMSTIEFTDEPIADGMAEKCTFIRESVNQAISVNFNLKNIVQQNFVSFHDVYLFCEILIFGFWASSNVLHYHFLPVPLFHFTLHPYLFVCGYIDLTKTHINQRHLSNLQRYNSLYILSNLLE